MTCRATRAARKSPDPEMTAATGSPIVARLARMICADRESFSLDDAREFAHEADLNLTKRLVHAAQRASRATIGDPVAAVISGSGDFLAARVARHVIPPQAPIISLNEAWGPIASAAGCAYAVVQLAAERLDADRSSAREAPAAHRPSETPT
jgi:uncharacterized hydantoinase/oxoprolinase family protein